MSPSNYMEDDGIPFTDLKRRDEYFAHNFARDLKMVMSKVAYVQGDKYVSERWGWHLNQ
jgi:hypothetical protein